MSTLKVDEILDSSGGSNAVLYGPASPDGSMGFRNRIINGDMRIDQRFAGSSVNNNNNQYVTDRWTLVTHLDNKFSAQQSTTAPSGFTNSLLATSLSAYSVPSNGFYTINQKIEGYTVADLSWGTASAKTVTLSFWVRSSLTGTFGGSFTNSAYDRSYPFTYTISSANTWEQKSVTIPGDTSGTWLTTNGIGLRVFFGIGVGTDFSGTAGAWASAQYLSATGGTSIVGTNGATFYITGVQLEVGSVATEFERRPYGTELQLCQRYFNSSFPIGTAPADAAGGGLGTSNSYAQNYFTVAIFQFPVQMRTQPTVTYYNPAVSSSDKIRDASGNNYPAYSQSGPTTTGVGVAVNGTNFNGGGTFGFTNYSASAEL